MPFAHPPHAQDARLVEVAEHVYAYLQPHGGWCVSNSGVLLGPESTTLIDTASTERRALALREAVLELSPQPVTRVVVTHHHGDHQFGTSVFTPGATVVAHEKAREANLLDGLNLPAIWPDVEWGDVRPMRPDLTFADRLTLHLGERPVELRHFGPAHTVGDIVAWIPDSGVLFAGDLVFSGSTPFVLMGSLSGALRTLEQLAALEPRVVISGHGPLGDASVIEDNARYLRWVQELAATGAAAGLTPLELARQTELGEFAQLPESERLVANLHRAYRELDPAAPIGERLPLSEVLADVIAFNNGELPVCLA